MWFLQRSNASSNDARPLSSCTPVRAELEIQIIQNGHNKFKKNPKNENPSRGVILCYIVERKNTRLDILIMFRKNLHKMTYHVRGFMAFSLNDRCYVLNHGIVCNVVPILCMCVDTPFFFFSPGWGPHPAQGTPRTT